jgi:hypothetical protein
MLLDLEHIDEHEAMVVSITRDSVHMLRILMDRGAEIDVDLFVTAVECAGDQPSNILKYLLTDQELIRFAKEERARSAASPKVRYFLNSFVCEEDE